MGEVLDEKTFAEENDRLKRELGGEIRQGLKDIDKAGREAGNISIKLGSIGESKSVINWKRILKREIEKQQDKTII